MIKIRHEFHPDERPSSNIMKADFSRVRYLTFTNLSPDFIFSADFEEIVNLRNPVMELSSLRNLGSLTDALESFAVTLTNVIPQMMKSLKESKRPYTLNLKSRSLKYLGYKYIIINWEKYDIKFKPPYKIYINSTTTLEITDEVLRKWSISQLID